MSWSNVVTTSLHCNDPWSYQQASTSCESIAGIIAGIFVFLRLYTTSIRALTEQRFRDSSMPAPRDGFCEDLLWKSVLTDQQLRHSRRQGLRRAFLRKSGHVSVFFIQSSWRCVAREISTKAYIISFALCEYVSSSY
jgi:hypothetical protein